MDCAEGSYGQLIDHFGDASFVQELLLKTKAIFITHIHGDHQLGVLKILEERDSAMTPKDLEANNKIYVVTPTPMMEWMRLFVRDSLKHPDMVELVPSRSLNPEDVYYYQAGIWNVSEFDKLDHRRHHSVQQKAEAAAASARSAAASSTKGGIKREEGLNQDTKGRKHQDRHQKIFLKTQPCPEKSEDEIKRTIAAFKPLCKGS